MSESSSQASRTQVLVVGAGPVGLVAALRLRDQGVDVRVVEQQAEHGTQTFPVVLHPMTLRILSALGLTEALFWRGRPVSQLAIYTEGQRRAVLDLPKAAGVTSGALTLPFCTVFAFTCGPCLPGQLRMSLSLASTNDASEETV